MKILKPLFLIVIFSLFSCNPSIYFQMYTTECPDLKEIEDGMVFENDEIRIVYDLWENYGTSNFIFFNKTADDIYLDLTNSHLIVNDLARTYYQNRVYTESIAASNISTSYYSTSSLQSYSRALGAAFSYGSNSYVTAKGTTQSSVVTSSSKSASSLSEGYAVSYSEQPIVCIPAHSGKVFKGLNINSALYRDCELYRFPLKKKQDIKKTFGFDDSPLHIRNILAYGFNPADMAILIDNEFWVSEISNYSFWGFIENRKPEFCGDKSIYEKKFFRYFEPNRFYIKYEKTDSDDLEH